MLRADGTRQPISAGQTPKWAPDHRRLVFERVDYEADPGPTVNLWLINADGTGLRRLTSAIPPNQVNGFAFGGSPPFVAYGDDDGIWTIEPGAAEATNVLPAGGEYPAIAPNGSSLAYIRGQSDDEQRATLNVLDLASRSQRTIFVGRPRTCGVHAPDWSPDGGWIAFVLCADRGDQNLVFSLWLVRPDGKDLHQVVQGRPRGEVVTPSWSPDGAWIAFTDKKVSADGSVYLSALVKVRPDGSGRSLITPYVGLLTFPWVGEGRIHRGSGGQSPASESIASAISAPGLWKP